MLSQIAVAAVLVCNLKSKHTATNCTALLVYLSTAGKSTIFLIQRFLIKRYEDKRYWATHAMGSGTWP